LTQRTALTGAKLGLWQGLDDLNLLAQVLEKLVSKSWLPSE
jgi:hypothetical protein